jgi:uncharacterized protein (TIGR00290 family)
MTSAYLNWSGGKDSSLCLHRVLQSKQYRVDALLTTVNAVHERISMHGVRKTLLLQQAAAIGMKLVQMEMPEQPSMEAYEILMQETVQQFTEAGICHAIFGDIFLEDLRSYREQKLATAGISAVFPLWKEDTTALMHEFLQLGFKAIIVCVNERFLDQSFCGRMIDEAFVRDLPPGVDICGENGEYHSFVFDGPFFKEPVSFTKGAIVHRTYPAPSNSSSNCYTGDPQPVDYGFYFCDLLPL